MLSAMTPCIWNFILLLGTVFATPSEVALSDGKIIPLVGIGVGNLQHNQIKRVLTEAIDQHGVHLIDTAAASRNEHIIADVLKDVPGGEHVKVITKVWYTHLGFERTLLSVRQSLANLDGRQKVDVVMLHWPRCNPSIPWMRCADEERELPPEVKTAGPAPVADSWKQSWQALEKLYKEGVVATIGVSNFDLSEMRQLLSMAEIKPQLIQGNVWSVIFDPHLMRFLSDNKIHFQAYNLNGAVLQHFNKRGKPYGRIKAIADAVSATPAQIVMQWLIQQNISIVPRSSRSVNIKDNARVPMLGIRLSEQQMESVRRGVEGLMRAGANLPPMAGDEGDDTVQVREERDAVKHVSATFTNTLESLVDLFWMHPETSEEHHVAKLEPGQSVKQNTYQGHRFIARPHGSAARAMHLAVTSEAGSTQNFDIQRGDL